MSTNREVAVQLGVSLSMVSRLRSGERLPSVAVMQRVEKAYGWPVDQQVAAYSRGKEAYSKKLRKYTETKADER